MSDFLVQDFAAIKDGYQKDTAAAAASATLAKSTPNLTVKPDPKRF